VWNGSISFGLVSIGVRAHSAVSDHDVKFHQLDPEGARIRYRKVSEATGEEVDKDDIQMGFEMTKGEYVTFAKGELNELRPTMTRTIEVEDFVDLDEIDPVYFNRTYWLAPSSEAAGRPYRLLAAAMEEQHKVGIGTVVMRNKEYLTAIRPLDGKLAMSTMRFADELVSADEVMDPVEESDEPSAKELKMAEQIIESLTSEWDPSQYRDTYADELRKMIDEKAKHGTISVDEAEPAAPSNVTDLMAALEASVKSAKKPRRERGTKSA
jgi:DNA end-binding protein Ku